MSNPGRGGRVRGAIQLLALVGVSLALLTLTEKAISTIPSGLPILVAIGFGSIAAALIARGVAIAQLRQAWINGLRDDISELFARDEEERKLQREVRSRIRDDPASKTSATEAERLYEAQASVVRTFVRIQLRLNPGEPSHQRLIAALHAARGRGLDDHDPAKLDNALGQASAVLKREWEVTKYGPLEPIVRFWKEPSSAPAVHF